KIHRIDKIIDLGLRRFHTRKRRLESVGRTLQDFGKYYNGDLTEEFNYHFLEEMIYSIFIGNQMIDDANLRIIYSSSVVVVTTTVKVGEAGLLAEDIIFFLSLLEEEKDPMMMIYIRAVLAINEREQTY
ncbi:hypothetical protein ACJX0J_023241, partial [Zea mays]